MDIAGLSHVRLNAPVPVKVLQSGVFVEKAAVPPTHMTVTYHPAFADPDSSQVFQTVHESAFIDPCRQGPVLLRYDLVIALG